MLSSYLQQIIVLVGINMIAVLGLSILTGFTGLFSFGHAGFMAIGAYVAAIFVARLHLPFWMAVTAGAAGAALVSIVIGALTLKLKGDYFCIATMGFGEAVRIILNNIDYVGGARGWESLPQLTSIWVVLILAVLMVVITWNLINSRHGRNMVAVREEELAAQMAGINVFRYKMVALVVSAAMAGIAGALLGNYIQFLRPTMFNMVKSTDLTIMVIFGGLGSISGTIVGTIILTVLPELFRNFAQWRLVIYGLAVIVIMVGRPQGVMGGFEMTPAGIRKHFAARRARLALEAELRAAERGGAA
ncbi:MAG TPA: branched-chain amino acid ABC transporter permease [Rectinemataceae bacterium]|nr:branched-chain amino acid ABC transporter permease [Rectinemataceae bacterium]